MAEITHRFVDTNGIHMHIAEAGPADGPLVVLCHGFPESWYSWRHQIGALADAGYHVVAPDQRGYGQTDAPEAIDQYTQLHLVGDIIGLLDVLNAPTTVIAGHDWAAPVAWNTALWRPDRVRAVIGLSVPFTPRAPMRPTQLLDMAFGETFMYILFFQEPGVAEADLEKDVRKTIRGFMYVASGDVDISEIQWGRHGRDATMTDHFVDPEVFPSWLTDADIDFYTGEFERRGLPRRAQLVSQHRPHVGAHRGMGRREGHAARAVHRGRSGRRDRHEPRRRDKPLHHGAEPAPHGDARRMRALDAAGATGRGQRGDARVPRVTGLTSRR